MHPILNIATRAARNAGNIIVRALERLDTVSFSEKEQNDFVSDIDQQAEAEIIAVIRKAYPQHGILAEESGFTEGDDFLWIIDPLDGTTNFLHGFPHFAVSIALQHKGKTEHGLIYDPVRQEFFSASRGGGARVNDRRIRVSQQKTLNGSLLGTGFPFKHLDLLNPYLETFKAISPAAAGIRRAGAAALDLAYVAAARLDGFWEIGLSPWDIAAGALMIQEAGGLVSDFSGRENFLESGNVVAGNPKVFKALLQITQPTLAHLCEKK